MNLTDKLNKETIIFPLTSSSKPDAVQVLLNQLLNQKILTDTKKLFSFINEHEKIMNPATGRGIAFHYSISTEVTDLTSILGVSIKGIDYKSPDQQKVHFILLILDTLDNPILHRKLIKRFQKFINAINMKTKILECSSNIDVLDLIQTWENDYLLKKSL
ncbi:MAG: hypothetical protein CMG50_02700 [Candidatus Marinimicrobia bacterium]|nr:hypothetical protein [Candidatus Neomarinimicrobiota bacterium]|tara:strand:- start:2118 stop:2597 length:480 start_codon:yes stop_codon:yes gene_type:complete